MKRNYAAALERLNVEQLENIIADAEVLLRKRREQASHQTARPPRTPRGTPPVIQYRHKPSARD